MLQFYVPDVKDVVEVEDKEEKISHAAFDDVMSQIKVKPKLKDLNRNKE